MSLRDLQRPPASLDNKTIALLVVVLAMCVFFMWLFAHIFFSTGDAILAGPNGGGAMTNKEDDPALAWFFFLFMEGTFASMIGIMVWGVRREYRKG
jgi:hypothetical protein